MSSKEISHEKIRKVVLVGNLMTTLEGLLKDPKVRDITKLDAFQAIIRTIEHLPKEEAIHLFTDLLKKYIQAIVSKKSPSFFKLCELVIPLYMKRADFENFFSDASIFVPLRIIYKRPDSHHLIRQLLLHSEPILIDLSKSMSIRSDDFEPLLCFYATQKLKLPDSFVENYKHPLRRLVLKMKDDVESFGIVIENLFIFFPDLCMYLDAKDFISLINRDSVSQEFLDKLIEGMAAENSSSSLKKLLTICLEEVDNSAFQKVLKANEKLYKQARSCIYPENLSPRQNYSPKFDYSKNRSIITIDVNNTVAQTVGV